MRARTRAILRYLPAALVTLTAPLFGCVLLTQLDEDAIPRDTGGAQGGGGSEPSGGCTSDAMCNDGRSCTKDTCEERKCVFSTLAEGTSCGDGDACNGDESCDAEGQCAPGVAVPVDDGDSCTADACDAGTGAVSHTRAEGCLSWTGTSAVGAPEARYDHSAVWTGSKMIVWGGVEEGNPGLTATGSAYDPETDAWTAISTDGAPAARTGHQAVWTGSKMIVWGGYADGFTGTGGIYDPAADTWAPMSTAGAPSGRVLFSMVWSGSKVIVWGGRDSVYLGTGGQYDPETDTWSTLPTQGAPSPRFSQSTAWAFDRMIVWGGQDTFDWHADGAVLLPALGDKGTWISATAMAGAPSIREAATAVWTGNRVIVWGGWNGGPYLNDGASFDPSKGPAGAWSPVSLTGAPGPRTSHRAVWTGKEMIVWGGCGSDVCGTSYGDGGRFTPDFGEGTWTAVPESPVLSPRKDFSMVWTGAEVIVWGGRADHAVGTGARAAL